MKFTLFPADLNSLRFFGLKIITHLSASHACLSSWTAQARIIVLRVETNSAVASAYSKQDMPSWIIQLMSCSLDSMPTGDLGLEAREADGSSAKRGHALWTVLCGFGH